VQQADSDIQANRKLILLVILSFCFISFFAQKKVNEKEYQGLIINASELYQKKYYGKAEKSLQKIVKKYPDKSASYYLLSKIYQESGLTFYYKKYAEQAYIRDTANRDYLNNLINAYHENNNNALLKKFLLKAIPDRKEIDYKILLALTDFTGFEENSTITQLNEIERQNPENEQVIIIKYQIYSFIKKYDSAKNEILKLINKNPDEIRFRLSYIKTLRELKDTNQFLKQINIIDSIDKSLDNTWILTTEYLIEKNNIKDITQYMHDIISNQDIDTLRKLQVLGIITSKINTINIYDKEILEWIEQCQYSKKQFRYLILYNYYNTDKQQVKAIDYLKKYAFILKSDYNVWSTILQHYFDNKDFKTCFLYCDTIEKFNQMFLANYYRIMCYYQMKDYKKMSQVVKKSKIEKYSNSEFKTFLYNVLALSCYESGKIKRSYKYYEKIIKIDSSDLITLNNYAYFLSLKKKKLKKAEMMSRRTIEIEPENSTYLDTYGWILFKLKKYNDALYYIEEAVKFDGMKNGEIMDHYGDILLKKGRTENALSAWEIANKLEPDNKKILKIKRYSNK